MTTRPWSVACTDLRVKTGEVWEFDKRKKHFERINGTKDVLQIQSTLLIFMLLFTTNSKIRHCGLMAISVIMAVFKVLYMTVLSAKYTNMCLFVC